MWSVVGARVCLHNDWWALACWQRCRRRRPGFPIGPTRTDVRARVGLVHLVVNSMGTVLQLASWRARRRGQHLRGAVLSGAALGAVGAGGYLGGHLVYAQRTGVDAEVPVIESDGWHIAVRDSELLDGQPLGVDIEDGRVVLVRVDGAVYALASVCSHAGGPLEKGTVAHASIECPWHGSRFRLGDGSVERGPATTPAFAYAARVRNGTIEIRRTRPST